MPLDPRRQKELQAWQNKQATGTLNTKQTTRLNYLQNRQGKQPQQGVMQPGRGANTNQRLLRPNTQIQNASDAQHFGNMVQGDVARQNIGLGNLQLQEGIGGSREMGIDPNTGQTFVRDSLDPEQQGLYESGNRLSQAGMDQAFGMLNNQNGGFDPQRQKIEDSVFENLMRSTNQQKEIERKQMDESLAQRGIPVGSELYNNQMEQFNNRYDSLTDSARDRATQFGGEEWSRRTNIAGQLSGMGPGMQTPNLQGYNAPPPIQPIDPLTSQTIIQDARQRRRKSKAEIEALRRVGGGGGGRSGSSDPNKDSPFYA